MKDYDLWTINLVVYILLHLVHNFHSKSQIYYQLYDFLEDFMGLKRDWIKSTNVGSKSFQISLGCFTLGTKSRSKIKKLNIF